MKVEKDAMKEAQYRLLWWACFLITVALSLSWCVGQTGLAGWFILISERVLHTRLVQISCLLSLLILCLPGYLVKNYFDGLAWEEHMRSLPPPDIRESAKRSKYIKLDTAVPPAPEPVKTTDLPKGQQEFIATCAACGYLFPAKRDSKELRCPTCGEAVPLTN